MGQITSYLFLLGGSFVLFCFLTGAYDWVRSGGEEIKLGKARAKIQGAMALMIAVISGLSLFLLRESQVISAYIAIPFIVIILAACWMSVSNFSRAFKSQNSEKPGAKKYPGLSIVEIIRQKKVFGSEIAIMFLLASIFVYLILDSLKWLNLNQVLLSILCSLLLLIFINRISFEYRVKKGLYGRTKSEAIEIISFILDQSSNIDFTDNDRPKKIIDEKDLAELQAQIYAKQLGTPSPA